MKRQSPPLMTQIRIHLKDIFNFGDKGFEPGSITIPEISARLKESMSFLPAPSNIEMDNDDAILTFNPIHDSKKEEGERLLAKGIKRAEEGSYQKAISIFQAVLDIDPLSILARRNLAMAYSEAGDPEKSIDTFLDVLRLDSEDKWSWVILANLYVKSKKDYDSAENFLNRALEIDPTDAYALNSFAAILGERKNFEKAVEIFNKAIESTPSYPNPYYGKATVWMKLEKPEEAEKVLEALFAMPKTNDIRSENIYQQARDLYVEIEEELAQENQVLSSAIISNYVSEIEEISGFPTKIEEADFKDMVGATIQMAWKYKRNYHLLRTRKGYPPILLTHLKCHETGIRNWYGS
jgi:tetratricopeptide (TPR) repeat protein